MKFGFAPIQSELGFDRLVRQSQLAESLGFDALWAHEHHSQAMMYPAPLMTLAVLAARTKHISLGTNMLLLPLHHPLAVAESAAMVDVMTGGRLVLGVSAGYAADEFAGFGVNRRERGHRMEEGLQVIRSVWSQDNVKCETTHCRLDGYSLFPKPVQKPHPPILVGALADSAIRRAARLGDGYVLSAGSTFEEVRDRIALYRDSLRQESASLAPRYPLVLNRVVHVVDSRAAKAEAMRFFAARFLAFYDRWGHADVRRLDAEERVAGETARDHFIIGEPLECIERIQSYAEMGVGHLACLMNFGKPDPESVEVSLRRFGEAVLPACVDF